MKKAPQNKILLRWIRNNEYIMHKEFADAAEAQDYCRELRYNMKVSEIHFFPLERDEKLAGRYKKHNSRS